MLKNGGEPNRFFKNVIKIPGIILLLVNNIINKDNIKYFKKFTKI